MDECKRAEWTNGALLNLIAGEQDTTSQGADAFSQLLLGREPRAALTADPAKWGRTIDPFEDVLKDLLKDQTVTALGSPVGSRATRLTFPPGGRCTRWPRAKN